MSSAASTYTPLRRAALLRTTSTSIFSCRPRRTSSSPGCRYRHHITWTASWSRKKWDRKKADWSRKKRLPVRRVGIGVALISTVLLGLPDGRTGLDSGLVRWRVGEPLNPTTFTPFTITSKEQVSPTAFILTLHPTHARAGPLGTSALAQHAPSCLTATHASEQVLGAAWAHGLWSVEAKQPQLQIAREYTPLPPVLPADTDTDAAAGTIRLLVRRVHGGEMSTYLASLAVDATVELRGPHYGFDVAARMGSAGRRVVCLAGGTGVAPALQLARKVLEDDDAEERSVAVAWANRQRTDCRGCGGGEAVSGALVSHLDGMRRRYGARFEYVCTVDEEGTFVTRKMVQDMVGLPGAAWTKSRADVSSDATQTCPYHSRAAVALSNGKDVSESAARCDCEWADGKNLLLVSGPDGFVAAWAGSKMWEAGMLLQGPLGGILAQLGKRHPEFGRDWLVLKL